MKLCYQAATPDVAIADSVTAYQGPLAKTFGDLGALGYDGVELMTLNPGKLDWRDKSSAKRLPDGTMVSPPLEDLSPFLPDEEMDENMIIPRIKG